MNRLNRIGIGECLPGFSLFELPIALLHLVVRLLVSRFEQRQFLVSRWRISLHTARCRRCPVEIVGHLQRVISRLFDSDYTAGIE